MVLVAVRTSLGLITVSGFPSTSRTTRTNSTVCFSEALVPSHFSPSTPHPPYSTSPPSTERGCNKARVYDALAVPSSLPGLAPRSVPVDGSSPELHTAIFCASLSIIITCLPSPFPPGLLLFILPYTFGCSTKLLGPLLLHNAVACVSLSFSLSLTAADFVTLSSGPTSFAAYILLERIFHLEQYNLVYYTLTSSL